MPKFIELSTQLDQLSEEISVVEQYNSSLLADKKILEYIIKDLQDRKLETELASKQQELIEVMHAYKENQLLLTAKRISFAEVKANLIAEARQAVMVVEILQNTIEQLSSSLQLHPSLPDRAKQLTTEVTEFAENNKLFEELLAQQENRIEKLESIIEKEFNHPKPLGDALSVLGTFAAKEEKTTDTLTLTINNGQKY